MTNSEVSANHMWAYSGKFGLSIADLQSGIAVTSFGDLADSRCLSHGFSSSRHSSVLNSKTCIRDELGGLEKRSMEGMVDLDGGEG